MTRPRRAVNQRLVTVAAKASAIEPLPRPTRTPQHSRVARRAVIHTVSPEPTRDHRQRDDDHPPDAEAVHQRGRERRGEPVQRRG